MALWRLDGLFIVNKPSGPTSFDVIRAARREIGVRKIGHAGTLDPIAEGVLVLGVGRGTKLLALCSGMDKSYLVRLRLGVRTDTRDAAGRVIDERDASGVSPDDLSRALEGFRGIISQTPPMFSAVRHAGQRLYEFARQGVEVERAARTVEISRLVLVDCAPPEATLEVDCSKGTYVRSLVDDLGARLGVGAVMTALVRTRVGPFSITEARPPGRLVSPSA